jgi:hypothetical protein
LVPQRLYVLAPLTGVLFVVLAVVAFIISGETPDTDDSPLKILAFYVKHDTDQVWAGAFLAWATVPLLFFVGTLRSTIRAVEGQIARLSAVAFAGGIVLAFGALSFAGFTFTLGDIADDGLTPQAAQALNALNSDFFFPVAVGLGTLMLATGLAIVFSRMLPVWLGWITLLIGIAALTPVGFFAFLLFLLWTLIVSVLLWRARAAETSAAAPPAPPPPAPAA